MKADLHFESGIGKRWLYPLPFAAVSGTVIMGLLYQSVVALNSDYGRFVVWAAALFGCMGLVIGASPSGSRVKWYRWLIVWINSWGAFLTGIVLMAGLWYGAYWLLENYANGSLKYFRWGAYIALGIVTLLLVLNEPLVRFSMDAKRIKRREGNPRLWDAVVKATPWQARPLPRIYVISGAGLNAISFGWGLPFFSAVGATEGLINELSEDELSAVMAHEVGHIINRDILVSMTMTLLVMIMAFTGWLLENIAVHDGSDNRRSSDDDDKKDAVLIWLLILVVGVVMNRAGRAVGVILQAFVSRQREYAADATGSRIVGTSAHLKSALRKIVKNPAIGSRKAAAAIGFLCTADPAPDDVLATHPSIENRLRALDMLEA
ncbi:MAG TPA: M48 family metalloprotease [Candidatus Fimivivens sp.]|nr:M48 family metalloprotease [Candidatus Fimivivens sp.]